MEEYRRNGARLGWLIDPARQQVAIYRAEGSVAVRAGSVVINGEAVLPRFSLDLATVFRPPF